ncbi:MAG: hypothetical protein FKY71_13325 [Spiribacter salinus]|uniref:Curlin n=1 Tax=Spiribacter salinus TaxID=1335746 RepID=A0A540VP92_9GAMM|nr:MAG: hypothetical protein FKY71_13325 [Spiribacter salinus]
MILRAKSIFTLTTALCVATGGMALAGSGNNASVLQESPSGAEFGNSLTIDQSGASGSTVAGVSRTSADPGDATATISLVDGDGNALDASASPDETEFLSLESPLLSFQEDGRATQSGSGNEASITVTGSGTTVGLYQNNSGEPSGRGNTGTITANSGQVLLYQDGSGNSGTLTTEDGASLASLLQEGSGNKGTVTVSGSEAEGLLAQIGNENITDLTVDTEGATVSFTVAGDNTTGSLPANVVTTSGTGQITIIQRPLGGN